MSILFRSRYFHDMSALLLGFVLLFLKEGACDTSWNKTKASGRIVIDVFKPACLTPTEHRGLCVSLQECPPLAFNTNLIRKSLCFRLFFIPGVCCPTQSVTPVGNNLIDVEPTLTTALVTTPSTTIQTTASTTKETPAPQPLPEESETISSRHGCGKNVIFTMRVVGGEKSQVGQWPWMAAIFVENRRRKEYWCGGTLISDRHVLTAAHCMRDAKQVKFQPRQLSVRLGTHDLRSAPVASQITVQVDDIKIHPNFRAAGFYNDIAVLKLQKPVKFTEYVKPICLPTVDMRSENTIGEFATIAGWGSTFYGGSESGILRQTELPIWDNADCDRVFSQKIEKIFVCAGLADGGKDACQGDSGSPLMLQRNGRWVQYGIVSFGEKCAQAGSPGVYTRLTEFLDWIKENTD